MKANNCSLGGAGRSVAPLAMGLALLATLPPALGRAQPPSGDRTPPTAAHRAGGQDRATEGQEAERLYQRALASRDPAECAECFERALAIHARLGRAPQAIQVGLRYREFLQWTAGRAPAPTRA
jgi:hypothetical protein